MIKQHSWSVITLVTSAAYFLALALLLVLVWHPGIFALDLWLRIVLTVASLAGAMVVALIAGAVADVVVRSTGGGGSGLDGSGQGSLD